MIYLAVILALLKMFFQGMLDGFYTIRLKIFVSVVPVGHFAIPSAKFGISLRRRFKLGSRLCSLKMMLKQKKLDEALRAGAASRRVNVDKLVTSTIQTLMNYSIEFTPATTSRNALQDDNLKYIILKPENEPTRKHYLANNIQSKKNIAKSKFQEKQHNNKFQPEQHNNKMKRNMKNRESIGKRKSKNLKKNRQKKQQEINKS